MLPFHDKMTNILHFLTSCDPTQNLTIQSFSHPFLGTTQHFMVADYRALTYLQHKTNIIIDNQLKFIGIGVATIHLGSLLIDTTLVMMHHKNKDTFSYCHPLLNISQSVTQANIRERFLSISWKHMPISLPIKHLTETPKLKEFIPFINQNFNHIRLIHLFNDPTKIHLAYLESDDMNNQLANLLLPTNICLWTIQKTQLPQLLKITNYRSCRFIAYETLFPLKLWKRPEGKIYYLR